MPSSPPLLSTLWSARARAVSSEIREPPKSWTTLSAFLVLGGALWHEAAYFDLLGSRNGKMVSFLSSVHMTNYYWPKSRYISRTVLGQLVLKFAGSTLISVYLGVTPIWHQQNPRHVVSFLLAFALVRSDALEARELSEHMRHVPSANALLNVVAALCKLRKVIYLADASTQIGALAAISIGTVAFSAAGIVMTMERVVLAILARAAAMAAAAAPASRIDESAAFREPTAANAGGGDAGAEAVTHPNLPATVLRNFILITLLVAGRQCSTHLYTGCKLAVLFLLCCHYNKALWHRLNDHIRSPLHTISQVPSICLPSPDRKARAREGRLIGLVLFFFAGVPSRAAVTASSTAPATPASLLQKGQRAQSSPRLVATDNRQGQSCPPLSAHAGTEAKCAKVD